MGVSWIRRPSASGGLGADDGRDDGGQEEDASR
jgi:hypothetical protein